MNKIVHFRDEIRKSLISYTLVPGIFFAILVMISAGSVWYSSISRRISTDCRKICNVLDSSVRQYVQKTTMTFQCPLVELADDKNAKSNAYSTLKEFTRRQQIHADFVLVDSDFSVILQGNETFRLPVFQQALEWGFLSRLKKNNGAAIIEVSKDYNAAGLAEILIGSAVVCDDQIEGYLIFVLNSRDVQDALRAISSSYVITDKFGEVFLTSSLYYLDTLGKLESRYSGGNGESFRQFENEAIYSSGVFDNTLKIYTIVNIEQTKKAIMVLFFTTIAFLVLLSIGMIVSATKISAQKTKTIDELVAVFKDAENGLPNKYLNMQTNVEFQTIADAYNKMLDDIKGLLEENKREVQEKYVSELKQLEMQFNPHFLYNTLETIKYLIRSDPDGAVKTIVSLSELLRYSVDGEISLVPIKNDMEYIKNYLEILKTRFSDKFSYSIQIETDVENSIVPKLILQPVIENAVKYGFDSSNKMNISVKAEKKDQELEVTVVDNGIGIEIATLTSIRRTLQLDHNETSHIGLYNVNRRIQLVYGNKYGITIKSKFGFGTAVVIKLPCVNKRK